jgi:cytochrome c oxidase subunit 2
MIKLLGLPPLASEHGGEVDKLILYVHLVMGALFVGWLAFFIYTLFRFRQSRNPKASYSGVTSHASTWIELAVAFVEAVLLIGFAVPLWAKVADKFPAEKDSTVIRIVAEQFFWNALYAGADGIFGKQDLSLVTAANPLGVDKNDPNAKDDFVSFVRGDVVVPVNKPVIAHVTSKDVIHSFKVNPLRITQDAIPGLSIPVHFTPTREGNYLINCAQLCGNSHAVMKGYVRVVSQEKYDQWAAEQLKKAVSGAGAGGFE